MEIDNKNVPKKEVKSLKFVILGDKTSGKTTFINTFDECYNSIKDNSKKGTLIVDNSKSNRVFDVTFTEINDIDRNLQSIKKNCDCIFLTSTLDKKENYNSVISFLNLFVEKINI